MTTYKTLKNAIITTSFGALFLLGSVIAVSAQNVDQQYRQWQRAQAEAAQRHQDYLRTRDMRDYRQWQRAQARAQREYNDYQRASASSRYNNGRYNGYYSGSGNIYNNGRIRIYTNGSYYETDSRGAEMLRSAVRNGYGQGYRQGQMDRRYGRGYNYGTNRLYESGTYGYNSYVARDQYQYYFQQGFQRGYEDGYNNTFRYGVRNGSGFNILAGVLNTILNIGDNR